MTPIVSPTALLDELGIVQPSEIALEAIAQYCGATIVYEPLHGCAARIVGAGDRAIITVDDGTPRPRQRFSAAHELGHWMRDRGKIAFSCSDRALEREWDRRDNPEWRANRFAAELLLPESMLRPRVRGVSATWGALRAISTAFETSQIATAIRFVECGFCPSMVVCCDSDGLKWLARSPLVPKKLWVRKQPGRGAVAAQLLSGKGNASGPETVDADDWIEHDDASQYCIVEDSVALQNGTVLSLLWWKDEAQIIALDEEENDE